LIRFLTLRNLKAKDIPAELEQMYENEDLEIGAVKVTTRFLAGMNRPWRWIMIRERPRTLLMSSAKCLDIAYFLQSIITALKKLQIYMFVDSP
jgi:hypothetical protein